MTAKEKLHDIIDNGTDKQREALITLLLLEGYDVFSSADPQEGEANKMLKTRNAIDRYRLAQPGQ